MEPSIDKHATALLIGYFERF
eukprot:COSAG01_NODE_38524_length_488_cov_1.802057_1_plen_20_part_10